MVFASYRSWVAKCISSEPPFEWGLSFNRISSAENIFFKIPQKLIKKRDFWELRMWITLVFQQEKFFPFIMLTEPVTFSVSCFQWKVSMAKAQFPTFFIGSRFAFPCRGLPAPLWHGCMSVGRVQRMGGSREPHLGWEGSQWAEEGKLWGGGFSSSVGFVLIQLFTD